MIRLEIQCSDILTLTALVTSTFASSPLPTVEQLATAVSSALAAKQPGSEQFLATLVAEASLAVMPKNPKDFNVDSVRVVKVLGRGLDQSKVVRGMVFGREPEGECGMIACARHIMAKSTALTPRIRRREEGDKGKGRGVHLWTGHFADGDQGDGVAEEGGRSAQLHPRRGKAARGGKLCLWCIFEEC
jgi:hypothetical protein